MELVQSTGPAAVPADLALLELEKCKAGSVLSFARSRDPQSAPCAVCSIMVSLKNLDPSMQLFFITFFIDGYLKTWSQRTTGGQLHEQGTQR